MCTETEFCVNSLLVYEGKTELLITSHSRVVMLQLV